MSEEWEIRDFLRANFARVNERFDRIDLRLDELTPPSARLSAMLRRSAGELPN